MGFRFHKSINLGKGFRINVSKSGIGYSWGVKGFRVSRSANGKMRKTTSIPGTGISYTEEIHGPEEREPVKFSPVQKKILKVLGIIILVLVVILVALIAAFGV